MGNRGYPGRRTENPYVRGACEETHVPTATGLSDHRGEARSDSDSRHTPQGRDVVKSIRYSGPTPTGVMQRRNFLTLLGQ